MTVRTRPTAGWNPHARLRCDECGNEYPVNSVAQGRDGCREGCLTEVIYDFPPSRKGRTFAAILDSMTNDLLPIRIESRIDLGQGRTPLAKLGGLGSRLYLKNETSNPTWSHKDRGHSVAVGAAKLLRARGIVTRSTGNHGASAAAYSAAAGLPAVVFCHPLMPDLLVNMIESYGGIAASLAPAEEDRFMVDLVGQGWFPSTSMDAEVSGRSNPYGAEAYKEVAFEILGALGQAPRAMIVPTAGGDTLYGITKGFAEAREFLGTRMPKVIAVQPRGANSLERSMRVGRTVSVPRARSVALSLADARVGRQGLLALRRWGGAVVSVSEKAIKTAAQDLAEEGFLLEPASAASLAGYREALSKGLFTPRSEVVLLATASGAKWAASVPGVFPKHDRVTTPEDLFRAIEQVG